MEKKIYGIIYLLIDGTNDFEYIGQTTRSLEVRFKQHAYLSNAIQSHGEDMFVKAILKVCYSKEELDYWEKHFIKSRDTKYPNGYNLTDGGQKGWEHLPDTCASISAALTGKKRTPQHCANLSAALKGRKLSPQHCANIGAAHLGKKRSYGTCASISVSLTGKKRSSEHCKHISESKKGKPLKDETRDRMSESRSGEKNHIYGTERPQITCVKISVKNRGETPFKNLLNEIDNRADISKILGIQSSSFSAKMNGRKNFTDSDKAKLAEFFDKPIDYLFQRDEETYAKPSKPHRKKSPYQNLIKELDSHQLSYTKLAELMNSTKQSIARKMRGERSFMEREKEKLSEIFGKPVEYLMARDE